MIHAAVAGLGWWGKQVVRSLAQIRAEPAAEGHAEPKGVAAFALTLSAEAAPPDKFAALFRRDAFPDDLAVFLASPIWRGGGMRTMRSPSKRTPRT